MNQETDFDFYSRRWDRCNNQDKKNILFSRAIKLASSRTLEVYEDWGNLYQSSNDHAKSVVKLKRVLAIEPKDLSTVQSVGESLNYLKKHEEALIHLKKSFEFFSNYQCLHKQLLQTLQFMQRFDAFELQYQEILNLYPKNQHNSKFYYAKAETLVEFKEYPTALVNFGKAIEISPDNADFHFQYASALYHESCYPESLHELKKVVALKPMNRQAHNNIAFLNYNLGNIHEAIKDLKYIIENHLESHTTYSNMILFQYHLYQNEDVIQPYIEKFNASHRYANAYYKGIYNQDLQLTELKLKEALDETTKDFYLRKLNGIKFILSLLDK